MKLEDIARRANRMIGDTITWVTLSCLLAGLVFAATKFIILAKQSDAESFMWGYTATLLGCAAVFIFIMHSLAMRQRRKNDELRMATSSLHDSPDRIEEMKKSLEQSLGTLPHDPAGRSDVQG